MWKFVYSSVIGTSHIRSSQPCQDASRVVCHHSQGRDVLIAVCADGAGSAAWSGEGAILARDTAIAALCGLIDGELRLADITKADIVSVCKSARAALRDASHSLGVAIRELASTLLIAIVDESDAVFVQLGDGAIVVNDVNGFRWVFWPQNGEYANTTYFLTDEGFEERLQVLVEEDVAIDEIALFTDGLERLALSFAKRVVHGPFLEPMLDHLRRISDASSLSQPLCAFLSSDGVNARTDDDKTLILATRRQVGADATRTG